MLKYISTVIFDQTLKACCVHFFTGESSLQSLLNNMDQNQLMQLLSMTGLGGAGGGGVGGLTGANSGFDSDDSRATSRNATAASTREYVNGSK